MLRRFLRFLAPLLLGLLPIVALAGERARVTILSTTDLHAHVLPVNYFTGQPDQLGLAKLSTLIAKERAESPKALLLDCGDTIQGSPLGYYHARKHLDAVDPTILAMNALRYDGMTVGNHEYNFGRTVQDKARAEATFPWLSANILNTADKSPFFTPYIIREVSGVKVAVIGLTTPGIPSWEDPRNIQGLDFQDPVEAARRLVAELRATGKADLIVVSMHMGLEEDIATGSRPPGQVARENTAIETARSIPGVDLIIMGHTHRLVPSLMINGVLLAQAGRWGDNLIRADLYLEKDAAGHWTVLGKTSKAISVTAEVPMDMAIVKLVEPYERETQAWLTHPIGHCAKEISSRDSRKGDTAVIDLIHAVQLEAAQAEISFAASFSLDARVPAGEVSVRDIYSLYFYENTLLAVEMTGEQVRQALEHSARYFLPYEAGRSIESLEDKRIPGYNFESAAGVSYVLDVTRPQGDRIVNLCYQGKPIDPARKFRVAVNNYRRAGAGGYKMFKDCPVLMQGSTEIRDLLIEWIDKHKEIPTEPDGNWRIEAGEKH